MTDAKDYQDILIYNNDFQNAVQGLSIIGMSRTIMDTRFNSPLGQMSVIEYMASHEGIDSIKATKHTDEKARWILIVWKDQFDNAKSFVKDFLDKIFLTHLPGINHQDYLQQNTTFDTPPSLHNPQPFGSAMQERAHTTSNRIRASHKAKFSNNNKTHNAWHAPPSIRL